MPDLLQFYCTVEALRMLWAHSGTFRTVSLRIHAQLNDANQELTSDNFWKVLPWICPGTILYPQDQGLIVKSP
eukprot:1148179-Pelagomonas_calceolata.AAC.1